MGITNSTIATATNRTTNETVDVYFVLDYDHLFFELIRQHMFELVISHSTFRLIFSVILFMLFSSFGIVTNIISLVIFYRQGILTDSCTPSLVALTLSDLCVSCFTMMDAILNVPSYVLSADDWSVANGYLAVKDIITSPLHMFTLLSCYITAYLSMERAAFVTFPFRSPHIFTPRRSACINAAIFCVLFVLHFPRNFQNKLVKDEDLQVWVVDDSGLIPHNLVKYSKTIIDIVLRLSSVVLIIVFNIVLAVKVNSSYNFRRERSQRHNINIINTISNKARDSLADNNNENEKDTRNDSKNKKKNTTETKTEPKKKKEKATKEVKLVRMLLMLSVMQVVCYLPSVVYGFYSIHLLSMGNSSSLILKVISTFLEIVNSSCNVLVYYVMSSKYKAQLRLLCSCCCSKNQ